MMEAIKNLHIKLFHYIRLDLIKSIDIIYN